MPFKQGNPGCPCCEPPTCDTLTRVCATVNTGCAGFGGPATGATVTVSKGGTDYGPCTTDAAGQCCIEVPESGTYTVTASVPGATPISTTKAVICGTDNNVTLTFPPNTLGRLIVQANLCNCTHGAQGVAGVTVSFTGAGSGGGATDGAGTASFSAAVGIYSVTVSYPTGYTETRSATVTACANTTVTFTVVNEKTFGLVIPFGSGCTVTYELKKAGVVIGTITLTAPAGGSDSGCMTFPDQKFGDLFTLRKQSTLGPSDGEIGFTMDCTDQVGSC